MANEFKLFVGGLSWNTDEDAYVLSPLPPCPSHALGPGLWAHMNDWGFWPRHVLSVKLSTLPPWKPGPSFTLHPPPPAASMRSARVVVPCGRGRGYTVLRPSYRRCIVAARARAHVVSVS